jgi:hypothetical protein
MATAGNTNVTVTADTKELQMALLRIQIALLKAKLARMEADN